MSWIETTAEEIATYYAGGATPQRVRHAKEIIANHAPAWHPKPMGPGLWILFLEIDGHMCPACCEMVRDVRLYADNLRPVWFGPIPEPEKKGSVPA
jgi:hypothetical protein